MHEEKRSAQKGKTFPVAYVVYEADMLHSAPTHNPGFESPPSPPSPFLVFSPAFWWTLRKYYSQLYVYLTHDIEPYLVTRCFCGDAVPEKFLIDESHCDMPCSGDSSENCGGRDAIRVHYL